MNELALLALIGLCGYEAEPSDKSWCLEYTQGLKPKSVKEALKARGAFWELSHAIENQTICYRSKTMDISRDDTSGAAQVRRILWKECEEEFQREEAWLKKHWRKYEKNARKPPKEKK
jgi:hypothetical protein